MRTLLKDEGRGELSFQFLQVLVSALTLFISDSDYHQLKFVNLADGSGDDSSLLVQGGRCFIATFHLMFNLFSLHLLFNL